MFLGHFSETFDKVLLISSTLPHYPKKYQDRQESDSIEDLA